MPFGLLSVTGWDFTPSSVDAAPAFHYKGAVYVFFGSAAGISAVPSVSIKTATVSESVWYLSVATA